MEKVRYMISDASNRIQVEAHVLRYWEEELELDVPRNEMGHRYYTEENLKQFQEIKRLKEEGFQLKAIKMFLHNCPGEELEEIPVEKMLEKSSGKMHLVENTELPYPNTTAMEQTTQPVESLSKLEQFQLMMSEIVRNAIAENNRALGREVSAQVGEQVLKEMNYLMRDREEQEEERFRKLDETIRSHQKRPKREKTGRKKEKTQKMRFRTKESIT